MGVKNSRNFNEMEAAGNLGYNNGQFMSGHMTPNDFFAYQNSRYPLSPMQQHQLPQRHPSMNMGAINMQQTTHNSSSRHPLQPSLVGGANNRLMILNDPTNLIDSAASSSGSNSASGSSSQLSESTAKKSTSPSRKSPNRSGSDAYKKKLLPTKSSLLQELLECPICMNLYENPHVLPCQHTFCKSCLVSLKNENTNNNNCIDCPICREKHKLGANGVDGLAANYTMKRLIELESMTAAEKEKPVVSNKDKAKCFVCQKFCQLKVCNDCSYMLCYDCLEDPNHDIIIESKIISRKKKLNQAFFQEDFIQVPKHNMLPPEYDYQHADTRHHPYMDSNKYENDNRLKLVVLCHSTAIEEQDFGPYKDEYGPYVKIVISYNDRISTLKKLIESKFGIACKDQILVYKDRILKNDLQQLCHYQIRQFSRVHVFDARDIKANSDDLDCDLYGIYQEAESSSPAEQHSYDGHHNSRHHPQSKISESRHKKWAVQQPPPPPPTTIQHINRRSSFQNRDKYEENHKVWRSKTPQTNSNDRKLADVSSSSQSYSSVIGSSSNEDVKDSSNKSPSHLLSNRRNQQYKTVSSSVNKRSFIQQQKYLQQDYELHQTNEVKQLITGQVKNLRRGSMSANKYSSNCSFRFRKLDELFKNEKSNNNNNTMINNN